VWQQQLKVGDIVEINVASAAFQLQPDVAPAAPELDVAPLQCEVAVGAGGALEGFVLLGDAPEAGPQLPTHEQWVAVDAGAPERVQNNKATTWKLDCRGVYSFWNIREKPSTAATSLRQVSDGASVWVAMGCRGIQTPLRIVHS
jgi:hypothetical protein